MQLFVSLTSQIVHPPVSISGKMTDIFFPSITIKNIYQKSPYGLIIKKKSMSRYTFAHLHARPAQKFGVFGVKVQARLKKKNRKHVCSVFIYEL